MPTEQLQENAKLASSRTRAHAPPGPVGQIHHGAPQHGEHGANDGEETASADSNVSSVSSVSVVESFEGSPTSSHQAVPPASQPPQQELVLAQRTFRPWAVLIAIVVLISVSALAVSYFLNRARHPSTSDAYIEGRIVRISPKVSGQVVALNVDDNTLVKVGDVLLEIDPADYQAKVDQARAAVSVVESSVQQADAAVMRAEAAVGESVAALASAQAEARRRASDYRRYAAIGTDGVSAQQLESAQTAMDVGERQSEAAEKKLAASNAELNVAKANVESARSQLAAAQASLRFAQLQLQYTRVIAPESGAVTKKNVEAGSFVSTAQPLMAIVPSDYWVVANFKEVQLERMRVGQRATIRVDAFPDLGGGGGLHGRVQSIQAGTGSRFQLLPPENATGNWVKVVQRVPVKIVFDRDQPGVEMLAPGMSVEVTVDTRASSSDTSVADQMAKAH